MFFVITSGRVFGILWVEARGAAKLLTVHRIAPHYKELTWFRISTVQGLRDSALEGG